MYQDVVYMRTYVVFNEWYASNELTSVVFGLECRPTKCKWMYWCVIVWGRTFDETHVQRILLCH